MVTVYCNVEPYVNRLSGEQSLQESKGKSVECSGRATGLREGLPNLPTDKKS